MALRVLSNVAADSHLTSAKPAMVLCLQQATAPGRSTAGQTATNTSHWHFVDKIEFGTRSFMLAQALTIQLICEAEQGGCFWQASVPKLGIFAGGNTPQAAMEDFSEDFAAVWDGLAFERDENLTPDAQELKRTLKHLVTLE